MCGFGAPYNYVSGIHCRKYTTVVITVDSCARAVVAAVKRSTLFTEFYNRSLNLCSSRTDFWKETEAAHLIRSQCTIRVTLKQIFQGKKRTRLLS